MDPRPFVDSLVRVTRGLSDASLRVAYVRGVLHDTPIALLAQGLDILCARAEQAEDPAREALLSVVDALGAEEAAPIAQRLREEAAGESLLALERLIRQPPPVKPASPDAPPLREARIPDYVKGRTLTLGERKSLAGRHDRNILERLLQDPHPDVIRRLLKNPRMTEDDIVRLAARRPNRPEVLAEIARTPTWVHRSRVRLALLLNPDTPVDLAAPITGLLVRQELRLVSEATQVPAAVRALCVEHLERRPPMEEREEPREPVQ